MSPDDFKRLFDFVSATRLAATAIAKAYYRLGVADNGRAYAVQAIGWSFMDAKNLHDMLIILHRSADKSEYKKREKELREALAADQSTAGDLEKLYPGVTNEGVARFHMTRAAYEQGIAACVNFGPARGDPFK